MRLQQGTSRNKAAAIKVSCFYLRNCIFCQGSADQSLVRYVFLLGFIPHFLSKIQGMQVMYALLLSPQFPLRGRWFWVHVWLFWEKCWSVHDPELPQVVCDRRSLPRCCPKKIIPRKLSLFDSGLQISWWIHLFKSFTYLSHFTYLSDKSIREKFKRNLHEHDIKCKFWEKRVVVVVVVVVVSPLV